MPQQFLSFCPYLRLSKECQIQNWTISPLSHLEGKWPDTESEAHVKSFLGKFTDVFGKPISDPVVVLRKASPRPLAPRPTRREMHALESALHFAVVDQNLRFRRGANSWNTLTADNGELFIWPTRVGNPYVAVQTGSIMLSVLSGGWKITDPKFSIRPPLEIHLDHKAALDSDVATAVYRLVRGDFDHINRRLCGRMRSAIDWLVKCWRNTPSIKAEDRIVFLKTGFEAITDSSSSYQSAIQLRKIFDNVKARRLGAHGAQNNELLWSPRDRGVHKWERKDGKIQRVTPLEHWFLAFAEARNTIIHEGTVPTLTYHRRRSRFNGHHVFTGEWVLRKAIKIQFEQLGVQDLWMSATGKLAARMFRDFSHHA